MEVTFTGLVRPFPVLGNFHSKFSAIFNGICCVCDVGGFFIKVSILGGKETKPFSKVFFFNSGQHFGLQIIYRELICGRKMSIFTTVIFLLGLLFQ